MPRSRLVWRLVVPAVLVGLVGWLGALEYRWLDQVSQADREQRRASLQQHAEEFADDFDRELSRLFVLLQGDAAPVVGRPDNAFGKRYDAWRATARDPLIVRAIYWASTDSREPRLAEYRPVSRVFTPVAWPDALASVEADFNRSRQPTDAFFAAPSDTFQVKGPISLTRDAVYPAIPAVMAFFPRVPGGLPPNFDTLFSPDALPTAFIAYLDRAYLASTFLPALARRYFAPGGLDPYRVAVIDPHDPGTPIMTSNWPAGTAVDPKHADASQPLFALRADLTAEVFRRSVVLSKPGESPSLGGSGGTALATPTPLSPTASGRWAGRSTFGLVVETDRGRGDGSTVRVAAAPAVAWQLVLQHSAGSLDTAVNRARQRNLWLSFGLLAVLAAGVVLIVTNAQRSERLARQQMDFVATVSHELRTPLAVIRAAAQNLSAGVIADPVRAKQYGELIETEGRRLTEMVEQVLTYAGIANLGRASLADRPVDLGALTADVVASCRPLAAAASVEIEVAVPSEPCCIAGDESALRSAIQNLVTNALNYGADGHWLRVEVRAPDPDEARPMVRVAVGDRGLGIDAEDRRHLFEPFYRGRRAVEGQIRGNGLGLSLVKRIVEAHGGQISLDSTPGAGATFTLELPAATTAAVSRPVPVVGTNPRTALE